MALIALLQAVTPPRLAAAAIVFSVVALLVMALSIVPVAVLHAVTPLRVVVAVGVLSRVVPFVVVLPVIVGFVLVDSIVACL